MRRIWGAACLAIVATAHLAWGQSYETLPAPTTPTAAAPTVASTTVVTPPPVVAAPARPGLLHGIGSGVKHLVHKICRSPFGGLLHEMAKPLSAVTGGGAGPPAPKAADLAAPGPVGVNAKIKQDQHEAAARQQAVRELGGVDCRYYPEAEATLIAALRCDRSECVRWEAAKALACGCCCSPAVVAALKICVSGSEEDGHPAERSPRVLAAANEALERCLCCLGPEPAMAPALPRPEYPLGPPPIDFSRRAADPQGAVRMVSFGQATTNGPPGAAPPAALEGAKASAARRSTSLYELWRDAE
jgi:hypothetical protein